MLLCELLNTDELEAMIDQGYIRKNAHPTLPYDIYNYTPKTQYDQHWTYETETCRGLIVDRVSDRVISRPFRKFHNAGPVLPDLPCRVFDKADGSLGVGFRDPDGVWAVATRGSFTSDQAVHATAALKGRLMSGRENVTFLFEIIYPANRIVVDYKGLDDLILLAVIDNETGLDVELGDEWSGPCVSEYDPKVLLSSDLVSGFDAEGYVCLYKDGTRLKVKHADYVAKHYVMTNMSSYVVYESLNPANNTFDQLLETAPDELHMWIRSVEAEMTSKVRSDVAFIMEAYETVIGLSSRKEQAAILNGSVAQPYVFLMLDNRWEKFQAMLWKESKPVLTYPFSELL